MSADLIVDEIDQWFFNGYLPKWVEIGATGQADPEDIFNYWGVPMHAASVHMKGWLLTPDAVLGLLEANHAPLRAAGYTNTQVLDRAITAYNDNAAVVDVIWSRCRGDATEIERVAVHFEIHRTDDGWRVIGIASTGTTENSLANVWWQSDKSERSS